MSILFYFVILTISHPLADFWFGGNRKLHYFVALNPLHWLYDKSPFRQHDKYVVNNISATINKSGKIIDVPPYIKEQIIQPKFWKYLASDQLAHVFLNLLFAMFLEWLL